MDFLPFTQLVAHHFPNARLLKAWSLKGGISASVTALEIAYADGQTARFVVRQHGTNDLLRNPNVASDEYTLLNILYAAGLPVPKPYFADSSGAFLPSPYVVLEYINGEAKPGSADVATTLRKMAQTLARIHRVVVPRQTVPFLPHYHDDVAWCIHHPSPRLAEIPEYERFLATVRAVHPLLSANPETVLHGDYWVNNLVWLGDDLVGVVDWEDAAYGDPVADLAIARLEMLWALGAEAMQQFTTTYQAEQPNLNFSYLPYWDLMIILRRLGSISGWGLEADHAQRLYAAANWFVAQALAAIP
ncbi:MAG: phosphotransferase family protein [Chloroflexi bacterium CFX4]|nr:phosphotransferase family protein [Chloroflexi bacterium CFX4]MDL1922101.1 phosphotransferase family protein [Chloroflexi bacterium CFX3]